MELDTLIGVLFAAGTLQLAVATATPIALGAYAGLFSERSGVVNIGIEGMMLTAAMSAAFASADTGTIFWGVIAALLSGALMAALHAVLSIRFKMNQIISGTVINFMAWGLTGHLYQVCQWGNTGRCDYDINRPFFRRVGCDPPVCRKATDLN